MEPEVTEVSPGELGDGNELFVQAPVASAEGERSAAVGYTAQYDVSAQLIIESLKDQSLEWIRVADPEAGQVDDLQIGTPGRVDAYQIKWSQYAGSLTFNRLCTGSGQKPSLIAQLAQGWIVLKERYPNSRVVVHLVTDNIPSVNDAPPGDELHTGPSHFAAFIEQAWNPAKLPPSDTRLDIPEEWQTAWNAIRIATDLAEDQFEEFIRDCELDFDFQVPDLSEVWSTPAQRVAGQDVKRLSNELQRTVASPEWIVHLSRNKLLRRMNWTERFEFRHRHYFPVDERLYQPIEVTVSELTDAIETLPRGYIVLERDPGSGKSSLLTKTLRTLKDRLVYYYAYVPDAAYSNATRGEAVNFLNDVSLELERHGIRVGSSLITYNRDILLQRLYSQLHQLGEDWKSTGHKTIILIDGLDHIVREQNPTVSLLDDLPEPGQIPEGVYFVLGTQTVAPLSAKIRASIQEPLRTIKMGRLGRQQIHRMIEDAEIPTDVSQDQCDRAYTLSDGHPLFLAYLIKKMSSCQSEEELNQLLAESDAYEGDIEDNYQSYWDQFRNDQSLQNLLGLLARIRRPIDMTWVRVWADSAALRRLAESFSHYFRIEGSTRWHFFHNGFRLFLVSKTAEFPPGTPDDALHRDFHVKLADICVSQSPDSFWAWEEIYHRASAGQHDDVLKLSTQEYFRRQFLALRPMAAIQSDILTALRSAASNQDAKAIMHLCLIGSEINQRGEYFDSAAVVSLLLELGMEQTAMEHLRSGNQLHVESGPALESAVQLLRHGMESEAQRIFHLAEPVELMPGSKSSDSHNVTEGVLSDWVKLATRFRSVDQVIGRIKGITVRDNNLTGVDSETATHKMHSKLLSLAAHELIRDNEWTDFAEVMLAFDRSHFRGVRGVFWVLHEAWRHLQRSDDCHNARECLDAILGIEESLLGSEERVVLAEILYRSLGNESRAKQIIEKLGQPALQSRYMSSDINMAYFTQRFHLNRLLWVFGDRRPISDIVPDTPNPIHSGLVLFERAICAMSHISARAWLDRPLSDVAIREQTLPILRLFARSQTERNQRATWHLLSLIKGEFYALLVRVVSEHGVDALYELSIAFQNEWDDPQYGCHWSSDQRRRVILAFLEEGFSETWARSRLAELDRLVEEQPEVQERVSEYLNHAEAWFVAGDSSQSTHFLSRATEESFGVGYRKDYQLNRWIALMDRINSVQSERASERISKYALAIEGLKNGTEGGAIDSAANKLVATACHWNPTLAIQLFSWLLGRGLIDFTTGLLILIRELIKGSDPPLDILMEILRLFILPLHYSGDSEMLSTLVELLGNTREDDEAIAELISLETTIRTHGAPSSRAEWLKGLGQGIQKAGIQHEIVDIQEDSSESIQEGPPSRNYFEFIDGSEPLKRQQVEEMVSSIHDLQQLLEVESENSFFDWTDVATRLIQDTDNVEELQTLADLLNKDKWDSHKILVPIALKLNELGYRSSAWEIGLDALNTSSGYGWYSEWDGGSRLHIFEALKTIDEEATLPLIYCTIFKDLNGNINVINSIVGGLSELLELLGPSISIEEVWPDIEDHTDALMQNVLPSNPGGVFGGVLTQDNPEEALLELIASYLDHPSNTLSLAAQRSLGNLLFSRTCLVSEILKEFLNRSEGYQERVLMLIESISSENPELAADFRELVLQLASSPNWSIRKMCGSIAMNCGWNIPELESSEETLPAIYNLHLPTNDLSVPGDLRSRLSGATIPDAGSRAWIVAPFKSEIDLIAEVAGVPAETLCFRVVQLMGELEPRREAWSEQAEREMRDSLSDVGLRLSYVRPRAKLARRAMFRAAAELESAGRIPRPIPKVLETRLRTHDPNLLLTEPSVRPTGISSIDDIAYDTDKEEWVRRVEEALSNTHWNHSQHQIMIAEETELHKQAAWGTATEIRRSSLMSRQNRVPELEHDSEPMFGTVVNSLSSSYPTMKRSSEMSLPVIIRNRTYGFASPGADWLAFNPILARQLGWSPWPEGFFAWADTDGAIMVESVWWTDGLPELTRTGHKSNESGEGWFVLATQTALDAIRSKFGSLYRLSEAERQFKGGGVSCDHSVRRLSLV